MIPNSFLGEGAGGGFFGIKESPSRKFYAKFYFVVSRAP